MIEIANPIDSGEPSEEIITIARPKHPRGVPQSQSQFPRGRSNFSSGTLPNRRLESTPVNTMATGHSNKMLLTTFKMDRTASRPRMDSEFPDNPGPSTSTAVPPPAPSHINNFSCPVNRGYLHDYQLHPQRPSNPRNIDYTSLKRHSLPSTHILYEKTKHRGGPNVEEQEKVVRMLRAVAEESEAIAKPKMTFRKQPVELNFDAKIIGSMNNDAFGYCRVHMENMKEFFSAKLKESNAGEVNWIKTGMMPRAAYEEKAYVIEGQIILTPNDEVEDKSELFSEFVAKFSSKITGMLQDQCFLEVPKMQKLCTKITPQHVDINVSGMAIGNCVNSGMFLVRGDFISQENTVCSV